MGDSSSVVISGCPLVRVKSGKFELSSKSGKSQGVLKNSQGNPQMLKSQGKVEEFYTSWTKI